MEVKGRIYNVFTETSYKSYDESKASLFASENKEALEIYDNDRFLQGGTKEQIFLALSFMENKNVFSAESYRYADKTQVLNLDLVLSVRIELEFIALSKGYDYSIANFLLLGILKLRKDYLSLNKSVDYTEIIPYSTAFDTITKIAHDAILVNDPFML